MSAEWIVLVFLVFSNLLLWGRTSHHASIWQRYGKEMVDLMVRVAKLEYPDAKDGEQ